MTRRVERVIAVLNVPGHPNKPGAPTPPARRPGEAVQWLNRQGASLSGVLECYPDMVRELVRRPGWEPHLAPPNEPVRLGLRNGAAYRQRQLRPVQTQVLEAIVHDGKFAQKHNGRELHNFITLYRGVRREGEYIAHLVGHNVRMKLDPDGNRRAAADQRRMANTVALQGWPIAVTLDPNDSGAAEDYRRLGFDIVKVPGEVLFIATANMSIELTANDNVDWSDHRAIAGRVSYPLLKKRPPEFGRR